MLTVLVETSIEGIFSSKEREICKFCYFSRLHLIEWKFLFVSIWILLSRTVRQHSTRYM
jgi:hypothetical protein